MCFWNKTVRRTTVLTRPCFSKQKSNENLPKRGNRHHKFSNTSFRTNRLDLDTRPFRLFTTAQLQQTDWAVAANRPAIFIPFSMLNHERKPSYVAALLRGTAFATFTRGKSVAKGRCRQGSGSSSLKIPRKILTSGAGGC